MNRRTGELIQQIDDIGGSDTWGNPVNMVGIVDANFDGRPDLEVPSGNGGAGPNSSSNYYLFDPVNGRFQLSEELSELTQSSVNPDGTISSANRGSCCQHQSATHRYVGGKLTLVADWEQHSTADGWLVETTRELKNGKWIVKEKRTPVPE